MLVVYDTVTMSMLASPPVNSAERQVGLEVMEPEDSHWEPFSVRTPVFRSISSTWTLVVCRPCWLTERATTATCNPEHEAVSQGRDYAGGCLKLAIPAGWGLCSVLFNTGRTQQKEDKCGFCNNHALELDLELARSLVLHTTVECWNKLTSWPPNSPAPRSCCPVTRSSHFWAPLHMSNACTVVARRLRASSGKFAGRKQSASTQCMSGIIDG